MCPTYENRADVDEIVNKAVQSGGKAPRLPQDHGFMCGHAFENLDGQIGELIFMEPGQQ